MKKASSLGSEQAAVITRRGELSRNVQKCDTASHLGAYLAPPALFPVT
jgi:hypothetical protein